jgi:hypothetical protein
VKVVVDVGILVTDFATQDIDPKITEVTASYTIPNCVPPPRNRDITEWLAIGASFASGTSANKPKDELNWARSRFRMSNLKKLNEILLGFSTSRRFVFSACSGAKIEDVLDSQIELSEPDSAANYPKIGMHQIAIVSFGGDDLGYGDATTPIALEYYPSNQDIRK